jgi:hypothetical protein
MPCWIVLFTKSVMIKNHGKKEPPFYRAWLSRLRRA